jgi:transposase
VDERAALTGIVFVLKTGIQWRELPWEMGCGSGVTCWRRLRDWQQSGVWDRLHELLLAQLQGAKKLHWSAAVLDSSSVPAKRGGELTGKNPTDRGRLGSNHHVVTDRQALPLCPPNITAANVNDSTTLRMMLARIKPVAGRVGRPQRRPPMLYAENEYHSKVSRLHLRV